MSWARGSVQVVRVKRGKTIVQKYLQTIYYDKTVLQKYFLTFAARPDLVITS
jgi:hypothetical protein